MKRSNAKTGGENVRPWKLLGERLRAERVARGWSLADLAGRIGVSKSYVSRLESGGTRPSPEMAERLAEIWGVPPGELLLQAGFLPEEVKKIVQERPAEALAALQGTCAEERPDGPAPSEAREASAPYAPALDLCETVLGDCFEWFAERSPNSVHAVVTDPPYGLKEYTAEEKAKLRRGKGGVWRIPPALDGCKRQPLPRFTVLTEAEKGDLGRFFSRWAEGALKVLVPGGHVFIATNPLLSHVVYQALIEAGFEKRGEIIRLVQTLRGGDRPKNAHREFDEVTVMPRSAWEPWGLFRKPCEGRVQDNLRKWKTGGLRRLSADQPFCDVIRSAPTRPAERALSPHPSLKPQAFMRQIVRAALPLGEGTVLDPFMGGGSTIAAACAVGYRSIGIESDPEFYAAALEGIPKLAGMAVNGENGKEGKAVRRGREIMQPALF